MVERLPLAAAALPGTLLAAVSLGTLALAGVGRHPMWPGHHVNMSEAAALRDAATVVRLLRVGENPAERRRIRAGYLFDDSVALTPLEAAIAARRSEIVGLLLAAGEADTWSEWVHARCLAASAAAPEAERLLDAYKPAHAAGAGQDPDCTNVVRPW